MCFDDDEKWKQARKQSVFICFRAVRSEALSDPKRSYVARSSVRLHVFGLITERLGLFINAIDLITLSDWPELY